MNDIQLEKVNDTGMEFSVFKNGTICAFIIYFEDKMTRDVCFDLTEARPELFRENIMNMADHITGQENCI